MDDKQFKEIIELLTKIHAEVKLANHKGFTSPVRAKNFR